MSKQILNLFWGNFLGKICPVHPGRSKLGKTSKNWKTFIFSKCPNTFPKVFKHVFNMLRGIFSGKKIRPVHPGGSRNRKISKKKWKKIQIFKIPKNVSKSVQICFEVIFSELFLTSATWRSKLVEIRKKSKKIEFLKVSKNVLKSFSNKCWNCFEVFFWKKILPSARWRVETWKKVRKMEKLSFFFKKPKYIPKKVQKRFEHALR